MKLESYIDKIRSSNPLGIKALFNRKHWSDYSYNNSLVGDKIIYLVNTYSEGISRQDIIAYLSKPDKVLLNGFLMTMIWGHGSSEYNKSDNRGPWKVNQMLSSYEDANKILNNVNTHLENNDIFSAYNSFSNMQRCRVSFFSKFLYFLGKAIEMKNYPLIFDARVAKSIGQLTSTNLNLFSTLEIKPKQDVSSYIEYVKEIHKIALCNEIDADKFEFFLFEGQFCS